MINKKVKYTGNVEQLLSDLPEKPYLEPYFQNTNEFIITEELRDIHDAPLIEIFVKIKDTYHYFYVYLDEIEFID